MRISNITLKIQPEHHTLTMRKTIDFFAEFSNFAEQVFDKTLKHIENFDMLPINGPVVYFHNTDLQCLDIKAGWTVAKEIPGNEEIIANICAPRKIVTVIDLGPYEQQDPTLIELFAWLEQNGYEMDGPYLLSLHE